MRQTEQEALRTYAIANIRIHVERVMKEIKAGRRLLNAAIDRARLRLFSADFGICARMSAYHCPMQGGKWVRL